MAHGKSTFHLQSLALLILAARRETVLNFTVHSVSSAFNALSQVRLEVPHSVLFYNRVDRIYWKNHRLQPKMQHDVEFGRGRLPD